MAVKKKSRKGRIIPRTGYYARAKAHMLKKPTRLFTATLLKKETKATGNSASGALYNFWRQGFVSKHQEKSADGAAQYAVEIPEIECVPPFDSENSTKGLSFTLQQTDQDGNKVDVVINVANIRNTFIRISNQLNKAQSDLAGLEDQINTLLDDYERKALAYTRAMQALTL